MAKEIERKFLVKAGWQPQDEGIKIAQGYLSTVPERTVRVRIKGNKINNIHIDVLYYSRKLKF